MAQQPWEEGYEGAPHVTCLETAPERLNWLQHSWVELLPLLRSVYRVHVLASSSLLQKCPSFFVCEGYKEGLEERAGPRASRFLLRTFPARCSRERCGERRSFSLWPAGSCPLSWGHGALAYERSSGFVAVS